MFKEGKNAIELYWWGARVYLSKSTVRTISGGIAIAGIWIPEPTVAKVIAILGVIGNFCPGGIRFDCNIIGMSIGRGISNVRFQQR